MVKDLKMTGERVVPDDIKTLAEYIQFLNHNFIYEYVKSLLKNDDKVLEVGFGEGYGSSLLSQACREIVGIDVEEQVVEYSNNKYGNEKCSFKLYDGKTIPFPDNTFDVIILFQVIEHIKDDAGFVAELHRVLKENCKLFITTPNRATRLKPGQKPWNRFHVREYYANELKALLLNKFEKADVYGVSATEEIHRIEAERIKQGFFISLALKIGIRQLIPGFIDPIIARLISKLRSNKIDSGDNKSFENRFSVEDFRVEKIMVDKSLDLFGIAVKGKS
ncbi:MAG: class I SAM-dependent methyltransferase [candidate division Zixibacteria bacterium]|nr:class I SAM-dependent methyltransferase [candidate division Zixibacteria bacterium]